MKAKIVRTFTMGESRLAEGEIVDLEDWRVARLVGEGLAVKIEEPAAVTPAKIEQAPDVPKAPAKGKKSKRGR